MALIHSDLPHLLRQQQETLHLLGVPRLPRIDTRPICFDLIDKVLGEVGAIKQEEQDHKDKFSETLDDICHLWLSFLEENEFDKRHQRWQPPPGVKPVGMLHGFDWPCSCEACQHKAPNPVTLK